jgi:NADPH:quinone reductase-like Zn-dependent oxidoreductase
VKAVVCDAYGPPEVLHVEDVLVPVPTESQLLVRVHAAAVTRTDAGIRGAHPTLIRAFYGIRRPRQRIVGSEFAGEVAAVGADVIRFRVGDRVFGATGDTQGANAEYLCVAQDGLVAPMPDSLSFPQGAAVCEGALYALGTLRSARLRAGQKLLVYGASGAIGSASLQLGRHFGAHVTAVCSTRNLAAVTSLGPDRVIDYTREDFTRTGDTYDVVHDAVGKHSFRRCRRALRPGGIYVTNDVGFMWQVPFLVLLTRLVGSRKVVFPLGRATQDDVTLLADLIQSGKYRPLVDRAYPLEQVVAASRYVETGKKTGNVVLSLTQSPSQSPTPSN